MIGVLFFVFLWVCVAGAGLCTIKAFAEDFFDSVRKARRIRRRRTRILLSALEEIKDAPILQDEMVIKATEALRRYHYGPY